MVIPDSKRSPVTQRLINLKIPVLQHLLKSSNVVLGWAVLGWESVACQVLPSIPGHIMSFFPGVEDVEVVIVNTGGRPTSLASPQQSSRGHQKKNRRSSK